MMVVSYKESGCKVNSSEGGEVFTTCLVRFCLYSHSLCTHLYWFKFAFITRQLISIYGIGFVMFYSKKVNMYIHVYKETCHKINGRQSIDKWWNVSAYYEFVYVGHIQFLSQKRDFTNSFTLHVPWHKINGRQKIPWAHYYYIHGNSWGVVYFIPLFPSDNIVHQVFPYKILPNLLLHIFCTLFAYMDIYAMATQTIRQFIGTYHCLKYYYMIFLKAKKPECYQIYLIY